MEKILIIGNVGADPKRINPNSEKEFVSFSVAVNNTKTKSANWYNISAYGKIADVVMEYVKKGNKVFVSGKPSIYGQNIQILLHEIEFLNSIGDKDVIVNAKFTDDNNKTDYDDNIPF